MSKEPGWHEDPANPDLDRYWDGERWTDLYSDPAPDAAKPEGRSEQPWTSTSRRGWYEDGADSTRLRYWDGTEWSDEVAKRPDSGDREIPAYETYSPPGGNDRSPEGWYVDPADTSGARFWDGVRWTKFVDSQRLGASDQCEADKRLGQPASQPTWSPDSPEGWYDDPHRPSSQRYWDGVQWTELFEETNPETTATAGDGEQKQVRQLAYSGSLRISPRAVGIAALILIAIFSPMIVRQLFTAFNSAEVGRCYRDSRVLVGNFTEIDCNHPRAIRLLAKGSTAELMQSSSCRGPATRIIERSDTSYCFGPTFLG